MHVSNKGEIGRQGPCNLDMLFGAIDEAGEREAPHKQSTLSSSASEASVEKGKIVCPTASEVVGSGEGLWRTQ